MKMISLNRAIQLIENSLAIVVDDDWLTYAYPENDKAVNRFLVLRPTPKNPIVFKRVDNKDVSVNPFNELIIKDTNGKDHTIGILKKQILEMGSSNNKTYISV